MEIVLCQRPFYSEDLYMFIIWDLFYFDICSRIEIFVMCTCLDLELQLTDRKHVYNKAYNDFIYFFVFFCLLHLAGRIGAS